MKLVLIIVQITNHFKKIWKSKKIDIVILQQNLCSFFLYGKLLFQSPCLIQIIPVIDTVGSKKQIKVNLRMSLCQIRHILRQIVPKHLKVRIRHILFFTHLVYSMIYRIHCILSKRKSVHPIAIGIKICCLLSGTCISQNSLCIIKQYLFVQYIVYIIIQKIII